jgi:hypothetical protein
MKIIVQRQIQDAISTTGEMLIDGQHACWTLEPAQPIPAGTYDLTIDFSERFQRLMPHVNNVPGHTGIRIHWGNWRKDTEGCTLVGESEGKDFIGQSVDEFNILFQKIQGALAEGPQVITYADPTMSATGGTGGGEQ